MHLQRETVKRKSLKGKQTAEDWEVERSEARITATLNQ